jgi:hypothetical protein
MQSRTRKRETGKARGRAEGRGWRVMVAGVGPRRGFGERGLRRHEGQARVEALGDGTEQGKGGGSMVLLLATAWHRAERRSGKGKGHVGDRFRHGEARGRESRSEEGESRGEREEGVGQRDGGLAFSEQRRAWPQVELTGSRLLRGDLSAEHLEALQPRQAPA